MIPIKILKNDLVITPTSSSGNAGFDIYASSDMIVPARGRASIPTGLQLKIPHGYYGRIAPRSGLAFKEGLNTGAGVIDSNYTLEIKVLLFNHTDKDYKVHKGDRVAQIIFEKYFEAEFEYVDKLEETNRTGGFGSSGK